MSEPEEKPRRKPKKTSPTQHALKYLRGLGYHVGIVEHWNPHVGIRQDLFGFIDLVAVPGEDCEETSLLAVQATAAGVSERLAKIRALDAEKGVARSWLIAGGRIEIHGWTTKRSTAKNADGTRSLRPEVRMRRLVLGWDPDAACITSCEPG